MLAVNAVRSDPWPVVTEQEPAEHAILYFLRPMRAAFCKKCSAIAIILSRSAAHDKRVAGRHFCLRLVAFAAVTFGFPAGHAFAEETEAASAVEVAQCGDLLAIVRDSLVKEVEVPCAHPAPATCNERKRPLLAITDYIRERSANRGDDCDTLLEVNRRLRALPPKR
ncbi:hypothetical protein [Cupriavidus basilensis]|uniref:Uncharacterized protein n=1 Tax=Cupriavidus basilensis TaxID=68895 RepID=A0A643FTI2_9BURK|nr:hypothetical protein [Cupriavidus basilensis]QOT77200.1 hypothetical protein F7R26_003715 [Cupriavidus basilensis]